VAEHFIIETSDLRKSYGSVQALAGLDLRVPRGAICGLLGRNGAGKTTTIKALLGMVRPTSGQARIFGLAADGADASVAIRARTAFVSEDKDLYGGMTVDGLMRFTAPFYPKWRADLARTYLARLALRADARINDLSRGMRTKLALLLAFSTGAELLILDEPTSGLDPAAIEEVLRILVAQAGADGTTVLFSSHQLADVEQIADRVAIVDRGRVVVSGAARRRASVVPPHSGRVRWCGARSRVQVAGRHRRATRRPRVVGAVALGRRRRRGGSARVEP
jgi:ABC-2 type transport system ATP-binding protein